MTTEEEIIALEAALLEIPIGVTSITDAAGNKTTFDRTAVEKRLDMLKAKQSQADGIAPFGISRLVAGAS